MVRFIPLVAKLIMIIMGIKILDREKAAIKVQEILTRYGCIIKTRLGLHEAANICSSSGLIILEFIKDSDSQVNILKEELSAIEGIIVKYMEF